uniref:RIC3 acetylcholine receptor chaperone n=1 Tax=Fundulus heteroclitus TaxID=8078 RepID=A0A3Q2P4T3_FUNHE
MTITTCQKVTLISCSVLCVSLFLPRMLLPRGTNKRVGPGFHPSGMHQLSASDDPEQWEVDPSRYLTHSLYTVEAMAKDKGSGRGKKYNLMAQAIPIYGFGILLYILYIMYKVITGSTICFICPIDITFLIKCLATDYELARLQEKLVRTEMMLERIVSGRNHCSSSKTSVSKKEEKLLRQLRQITLLIEEGRLEGASPEMEAEEVPYSADWEGYPEETYPAFDDPCKRHKYETIRLEEYQSQPTAEALAERMEQEEEEIMARKLSIVQEEDEEEQEKEEESAEEDLDEEEEEDDIEEELGEIEEEVEEAEEEKELEYVEEEDADEDEDEEQEAAEKKLLLSPALPVIGRKQEKVGFEVSKELQQHRGGKKQITFSDKKHVFHYPKEDTYEEDEEEEKEDEIEEGEADGTEVEEEEEGDDDPLMEAESLLFSCVGTSNPEEQAEEVEEEYFLTLAPVEDEAQIHVDVPKEVGQNGLRMRNRRER